jgi:DNA-binding NarL/FixJ family response regulator
VSLPNLSILGIDPELVEQMDLERSGKKKPTGRKPMGSICHKPPRRLVVIPAAQINEALTAYQVHIMRQMVEGSKLVEIAAEMQASKRSIDQQVEAMRRKTGCRTSAQMTALYVLSGAYEK